MDSPTWSTIPVGAFISTEPLDSVQVQKVIHNMTFENVTNQFQMFPSWNKATQDLVSLSPKETTLVAGISVTQLGSTKLGTVHSLQYYDLKYWVYMDSTKTPGAFSADSSTDKCC